MNSPRKSQDLPAACGRNPGPGNNQYGDHQRSQQHSGNNGNRHAASPVSEPLLERSDVLDQVLDLIVGELLVIGRHLVFALLGDVEKLGVRCFGKVRRVEILHPKLLSGCRVTLAVGAVARLAL